VVRRRGVARAALSSRCELVSCPAAETAVNPQMRPEVRISWSSRQHHRPVGRAPFRGV